MTGELVVKVGGSLYDLPRLGDRLQAWLAERDARVLLIPGGGPAADWIRDLDAQDDLGSERAHWLALRALTFAAHVLAQRVPGAVVIDEVADRARAWRFGQVPILDMHAFASADEARHDHLDHSWAVSSDSLAARAAVVTAIEELALLKSQAWPPPIDWSAAASQGFVDEAFPAVLATAGSALRVSVVNFRAWRPASNAAIGRGIAP
jgi:5-(aminomethyl)-3-furanmethanol phosphate kinase